MARKFRVVQGCPAPELIAPYMDIICDGAQVNSIYRGEDAKSILHMHGHSTQAEIHQQMPAISNPPGRSTHECRGDGVAYGKPAGAFLEDWQCGFDVNDGDVAKVIAHAKKLGWKVYQPYRRGVEYHHLNFLERPTAKGKLRLKVIARRKRLPKR